MAQSVIVTGGFGALGQAVSKAFADRGDKVARIDFAASPASELPGALDLKLLVLNQDATPEEFESFELNREKVIMGRRKAVIFIGPLHPGRYPYFGEFHPETAQGTIIAE